MLSNPIWPVVLHSQMRKLRLVGDVRQPGKSRHPQPKPRLAESKSMCHTQRRTCLRRTKRIICSDLESKLDSEKGEIKQECLE